MFNERKRMGWVVAAAVAMCATASARAGMMELGMSGWTASWDDSLDPFVSVVVDKVTQDAVFIEKFAEFTEAPMDRVFESIQITFTQTSMMAVPYVVIEDEGVTNSTGTDWTGFNMTLFSEGVATFDTAMTAASGGGGPIGFSVSPFTTAMFTNADTRLQIGGGTIPGDGGLWNPGGGASDGQLWIAANTGDVGTEFVLDELPVPEPATLALFGLGAALMRRRTARA